jgi:hypothetical protein
LPTPLEPMTQLSELLGMPRLRMKRNDCAGMKEAVRLLGLTDLDENIVVVHTGGQARLFAYEPAFAA